MNARCFVTLALFLSLMLLPLVGESLTAPLEDGFSITNIVGAVDTVVVGRVTRQDFVVRDNVTPIFTTDITVQVRDLIKGEPSLRGSTVTFMIFGGFGVDPATGEDVYCEVSDSPEFALNEDVLLFLRKSTDPVYRGIHNGFYPFGGEYGKREIVSNKVNIPYTFRTRIMDNYDGVETPKDVDVYRNVELPLDLVVKIAKASVRDPAAMIPLEREISNVAATTAYGTVPIIGSELRKKLDKKAQGVIDRPD